MSIVTQLGSPLFNVPEGGNYRGFADPLEGFNLFPFGGGPNIWGPDSRPEVDEVSPSSPRLVYAPAKRNFSGLEEIKMQLKNIWSTTTGKIAILGLMGLAIYLAERRGLIRI